MNGGQTISQHSFDVHPSMPCIPQKHRCLTYSMVPRRVVSKSATGLCLFVVNLRFVPSAFVLANPLSTSNRSRCSRTNL